MERICPRCGESSRKVQFAANMCLECFIHGKSSGWCDKVEVPACVRCSKVKTSGKWKGFSPSLIESIVARKMKGIPGKYVFSRGRWEGEWVEGGETIEFDHAIEIVWRKELCPTCNRMSSGYHEAIVQVRGPSGKVLKLVSSLERAIIKHTFIAKKEKMHGGIDIFVGEKEAVAGILRERRIKYLRTEKLVGEKKGKRLYRSTFRIRVE